MAPKGNLEMTRQSNAEPTPTLAAPQEPTFLSEFFYVNAGVQGTSRQKGAMIWPLSCTLASTFNFDRARVPVARTGPFDATATWAARCPLSPPEFRVNTVSDRGQESHRARSDNSSGGGCKRIMLRPLLESQGRGIAHNCEREVI